MSRKLRKSEFWVYVLITVPALAFYLFAVVAPFLFGTIPSSFRNWNVMKNTNTFTGMANYVHMFTKDAAFAKSLRFTVKLGLGSLIFVNLFALLVALMLEKKHVFARNAARTKTISRVTAISLRPGISMQETITRRPLTGSFMKNSVSGRKKESFASVFSLPVV